VRKGKLAICRMRSIDASGRKCWKGKGDLGGKEEAKLESWGRS
jgi:hypothetical protein